MTYEGPKPVTEQTREKLRANAAEFNRRIAESKLRAQVLRVLGPSATEEEISMAIEAR